MTLPVLTIVRHSYLLRGLALVQLSNIACEYFLQFVLTFTIKALKVDANPTSSYLTLFVHHHCAKALHQPYILFGFQVVFNFPSLNCSATPVCQDLTNIEFFCFAFHSSQPP